MSDVIRRFRITTAPYRQAEPTMDGRESPFTLPAMREVQSVEVPDVVVEGVPPVTQTKPKQLKRNEI